MTWRVVVRARVELGCSERVVTDVSRLNSQSEPSLRLASGTTSPPLPTVSPSPDRPVLPILSAHGSPNPASLHER